MKIVLLFLLLAEITIIGYSQNLLSDQLSLDSIFEPKLPGQSFIAKSGLLGSQYYNDDWVESDLLLVSGEKVFNKLLKYNGFIDEVIWLTPENFKQVKIDKFAINEFVLKSYLGKSVCFKRINTKQPFLSDSTDIFAEVILESRLSLYIYRKMAIAGSVSKDNKGVNYTYNEIEPTPVYYLKLTNNRFINLQRLKRRALWNLFPEQKTEIRKLLRQNHQSLSNEDDLLKIVNLLNKEIFH